MVAEQIPLISHAEKVKELALLQKKIRSVYAQANNNWAVRNMVNTFIQPFLEMRYAWEHFGDALLDDTGSWRSEVVEQDIMKAELHLIRCYTDLLEWHFYCIKTHVYKTTRWASRDDIAAAMPDYYSDTFILYAQTEQIFFKLKSNPENNARIDDLDQASANCTKILNTFNENALKELNQKAWHSRLVSFLLGGVATILFGLVLWLITSCLS